MSTRTSAGIVLQWLYQTGRFVLGVVFLASGILKITSPDPAAMFVGSILGIESSPAIIVVYLISFVELLLGVLLIAGIKRELTAASTSIILLLFTFAGLSLADSGQSCGCFGSAWDSTIDEMFFFRNMLMLVASLYLLWYEGRMKREGVQ